MWPMPSNMCSSSRIACDRRLTARMLRALLTSIAWWSRTASSTTAKRPRAVSSFAGSSRRSASNREITGPPRRASLAQWLVATDWRDEPRRLVLQAERLANDPAQPLARRFRRRGRVPEVAQDRGVGRPIAKSPAREPPETLSPRSGGVVLHARGQRAQGGGDPDLYRSAADQVRATRQAASPQTQRAGTQLPLVAAGGQARVEPRSVVDQLASLGGSRLWVAAPGMQTDGAALASQPVSSDVRREPRRSDLAAATQLIGDQPTRDGQRLVAELARGQSEPPCVSGAQRPGGRTPHTAVERPHQRVDLGRVELRRAAIDRWSCDAWWRNRSGGAHREHRCGTGRGHQRDVRGSLARASLIAQRKHTPATVVSPAASVVRADAERAGRRLA